MCIFLIAPPTRDSCACNSIHPPAAGRASGRTARWPLHSFLPLQGDRCTDGIVAEQAEESSSLFRDVACSSASTPGSASAATPKVSSTAEGRRAGTARV